MKAPKPAVDEHKIGECRGRASTQFERTLGYLKLVAPVVPRDDEDSSRQFLYQSVILMIQATYEEYLRCVVSLGTFWKAPAIRQHLGQGQADPAQYLVMPMSHIALIAQEHVRFEDRAKRLKAIIEVVTGAGPFPNADTEQKCIQFAEVRNSIAHRGGLPLSVTAPIGLPSSVAVQSKEIGPTASREVKISSAFFGEGLGAVQSSIAFIEQSMTKDRDLQF